MELRRALAVRRKIFLCYPLRGRHIRKVVPMPMDKRAASPSSHARHMRVWPLTGADKSPHA
ncbi:MAG TPA: hypothetical protein DHN18_01255 [Oscillibacter sp.]|nr:hypothetical protein [Oscillibacter sp.]